MTKHTEANNMLWGHFNERINPRRFAIQQKYQLHLHQRAIIIQNKSNRDEVVALRLRTGRVGWKQWLNEVCVYLLPNFGHDNVLEFLGCEKYLSDDKDNKWFKSREILGSCSDEEDEAEFYYNFPRESDQILGERIDDIKESHLDRRRRVRRLKQRRHRSKAQFDYWILNDYSGCITLRHYLMMHPIDWSTLLKIAHGIMAGLDYLHEYADHVYDNYTSERQVDAYIKSTRGALKRIVFKDERESNAGGIYMKPPNKITIIHRNLSSLNVVLKRDNTACIWNFGYAYVYHPFQPMNHDLSVDAAVKDVHQTSPYSPPEVLIEKGHFTLESMKAIDMYSSGMIFWELISRCILPPLSAASDFEQRQRGEVSAYKQPLEYEFRGGRLDPRVLRYAVAVMRARPLLRLSWVMGKKTSFFVDTIRQLWDQDADGRVHASTVMQRLEGLQVDVGQSDDRNKFPILDNLEFDKPNMWPPKIPREARTFINFPPGSILGDKKLIDMEDEPEPENETLDQKFRRQVRDFVRQQRRWTRDQVTLLRDPKAFRHRPIENGTVDMEPLQANDSQPLPPVPPQFQAPEQHEQNRQVRPQPLPSTDESDASSSGALPGYEGQQPDESIMCQMPPIQILEVPQRVRMPIMRVPIVSKAIIERHNMEGALRRIAERNRRRQEEERRARECENNENKS